MDRINNRKTLSAVLLLLYCISLTAGETLLTRKETLYSTRTGNPILDLPCSIEVKSVDTNPKEFYLVFDEISNERVASDDVRKSLWIFNKNFSAKELKKNLKDRDYPIETEDINLFLPFSKNAITFVLKDWSEVRSHTQFPFYADAPAGSYVELQLRIYIATKTRKKTTIDDEAELKLRFRIPQPPVAAKKANSVDDSIRMTRHGGSFPIPDREEQEAQQEDSLRMEEEKRTKQAHALETLIAGKQGEADALLLTLTQLSESKEKKTPASTLDSLEAIVLDFRQKAGFIEKGHSDILLTNESIQDQYTRFGTTLSIATKKIEELRQQPEETNWLLYAGIGLGIVVLGSSLFMQIWNPIRMKRQLRHQQKMLKEEERKRLIESVDVTDLDEI